MRSILVILISLVFSTECLKIVNHMPGSTLMGMREQPIHTTLVTSLERTSLHRDWTEEKETRFLRGLSDVLQQDQCLLSFSGVTEGYIVLKIYCPITMDNSTETDDVPPLPHTQHYLGEWSFPTPEIHVNRRISHPLQWYGGGTPEQLEMLMRNYHEHKAHPRNYHSNAVETPAPWNLDRVDMHFGLLDNEYHYNQVAANVIAYVIDTGVRITNQEFQDRAFWLANAVGDNVNTDCVGHGTHVASVIGGQTFGIAKQVQIQAVKVLDCTGNGDLFTITAGVAAVIQHKQAQASGTGFIASMSLGGDLSTGLNQIVTSLYQNGITTVVAAGNDGADACHFSPASLGLNSPVLTVGASNQQDQRPQWSNYGACVSLSAPGQSIIGAYSSSDVATAILSGTSMATPHVSGVAALVLSQDTTLTPSQVKQEVLAWVTPSAITQVSSQGGGKNLLYSLIVHGSPPDFTAPTPTGPPPPTPSIPIFDSASHHTQINALLLSLFILLLCCLLG